MKRIKINRITGHSDRNITLVNEDTLPNIYIKITSNRENPFYSESLVDVVGEERSTLTKVKKYLRDINQSGALKTLVSLKGFMDNPIFVDQGLNASIIEIALYYILVKLEMGEKEDLLCIS